MIVSTSLALGIARETRKALPPSKARRIMKKFRAEFPVSCPAIDQLNGKMNAAGLALPQGRPKRLDRRSEYVKAMAARRRLILDQLRGAGPDEIQKRVQVEFSPG